MKLHDAKTGFGYEDIQLLINTNTDIVSRDEVDLSTRLSRNVKLKYPIILSPMDTVSSVESCIALNKMGAAGILHRFMSFEERIEAARKIKEESGKCYVAVGLNDNIVELDNEIDVEVDVYFLDCAHGGMRRVLEWIKKYQEYILPDLITGNTQTMESVSQHLELGSDGIRHGIGIGCFAPHMKVDGIYGRKNIIDVEIGDYVYTHTGEPKKVIDLLKRKEENKLIRINDILCTENHPFYVIHKASIKFCKSNEDIQKYAHWLKAKKITKEYMLLKIC